MGEKRGRWDRGTRLRTVVKRTGGIGEGAGYYKEVLMKASDF